jgi:DNA-binding helix-hairpin-helix protein with protein kinase domain
MKVLDANGAVVELRTKLGEGGEGSVWASPTAANRAVKIYLKPLAASKAEKLRAMTGIADSTLLSAAAWPIRVVCDAGNVPVGFEMPKLAGQKQLHEMLGAKSRLKAFPNANWQMLVHAAGNLAAAFEGLHARGIVVGDVNSNNVVVQDDARVLFIDCDSFQIRSSNRVFRCEVGVPEYQPPELQGIPFGSVDRQVSSDAFGMAVMIFQLLFVGKHPFMGRLPHPGANDPTTVGEHIARGNYFYDERAAREGLKPPPASLTLAAVTPALAKLFERAFRGQAQERPSAGEWRSALAELERNIVTCSVTPAHRYLRGTSCPWCTIELQSQIIYFAAPTLISPTGTVDDSIWATFPDTEVERVWAEIAKVQPPNVRYVPPPAESATPTPMNATLRKRTRFFIGILAALALGVAVVALIPAVRSYEWYAVGAFFAAWFFGRSDGGAELAGRRQRLADAQHAYLDADLALKAICEGREFVEYHSRLQSLRRTLLDQKVAYDRELAQTRERGEEKARRDHLDAHFIKDANIKGIGEALTRRLAAWNIETALDVDRRIYGVNGIGEKKALALLAWRESVARRFRFEPKMIEGLVRDVKVKFAQERSQARNSFRVGPGGLRQIVRRAETQAPAALATAIERRKLLDQARADMRPFPRLLFR